MARTRAQRLAKAVAREMVGVARERTNQEAAGEARARAEVTPGTIAHMKARELISDDQERAAQRIELGFRLITGEVDFAGSRLMQRLGGGGGEASGLDLQAVWQGEYKRWTDKMLERRRAARRWHGRESYRRDVVLSIVVGGLTIEKAAALYRRHRRTIRRWLIEGLDLWVEVNPPEQRGQSRDQRPANDTPKKEIEDE